MPSAVMRPSVKTAILITGEFGGAEFCDADFSLQLL
jgi:hypothetical protein